MYIDNPLIKLWILGGFKVWPSGRCLFNLDEASRDYTRLQTYSKNDFQAGPSGLCCHTNCKRAIFWGFLPVYNSFKQISVCVIHRGDNEHRKTSKRQKRQMQVRSEPHAEIFIFCFALLCLVMNVKNNKKGKGDEGNGERKPRRKAKRGLRRGTVSPEMTHYSLVQHLIT